MIKNLEMQIKTAVRYHFTFVKISTINNNKKKPR